MSCSIGAVIDFLKLWTSVLGFDSKNLSFFSNVWRTFVASKAYSEALREMSLFVAPAAQCGPSATIPPRVHRVGLVGRGRDVVCRAGSLPRRRPSANALSIVPDVRLDDAAAMIFAENSTHDGKESDFSPVVMSRGTGSGGSKSSYFLENWGACACFRLLHTFPYEYGDSCACNAVA